MSTVDQLKERLARRDYTVGVIGLGYVGLPLILRFGEVGFRVIGFDIDARKIEQLNDGGSYIQHVPAARVKALRAAGRFEATTALERLGEPDAIIICVPTPLARASRSGSALRGEDNRRGGGGAATRSTGLPGEHDLPGDHRGGRPAAAHRARPSRGGGLFPGLLARARGPRQRPLRNGDHPQGRRRHHAQLPRPRDGALRRSDQTDRPGRRPRGWRRPPRFSRTSTAR